MNIYFVLSEWVHSFSSSFNPPEDYRIAEVVIANNPSQAKWLAWKNDKNFNSDVRDMPRFRCELKMKNVPLNEPKVIEDHDTERFLKEDLNIDEEVTEFLANWFWRLREDFLDYENYVNLGEEERYG